MNARARILPSAKVIAAAGERIANYDWQRVTADLSDFGCAVIKSLLDPAECAAHMYDSGFMQMFRSSLFTRIVPIVKDIGLWGDTIRNGYETMGIIGYAQTAVQALSSSTRD